VLVDPDGTTNAALSAAMIDMYKGLPDIMPGKELVKMLEEGRIVAIRIVDPCVVVVAHCDREEHLNAVAVSSLRQTVDEGVIRLSIRPHQELPLRAAARDHVRVPR
jgi:hypothetical protein